MPLAARLSRAEMDPVRLPGARRRATGYNSGRLAYGLRTITPQNNLGRNRSLTGRSLTRNLLPVRESTMNGLCRLTTIACFGLLAIQARAEPVTLSVSMTSDIATLDPVRASATSDLVPVGWIYNALVRFKPGSADPKDLEPDLAESWDVSADHTVWTFHLRHGVKFQGDWGTMDAEDVVFSLTRAADPKRSTFASELDAVNSVQALDPSTVRIIPS